MRMLVMHRPFCVYSPRLQTPGPRGSASGTRSFSGSCITPMWDLDTNARTSRTTWSGVLRTEEGQSGLRYESSRDPFGGNAVQFQYLLATGVPGNDPHRALRNAQVLSNKIDQGAIGC